MSKHLCQWSKKDLEKEKDDFVEIVRKPKFVCRRCLRVASSRKYLCKPELLAEKD